jgi:hypothetical protein
VHGIFGGFDQSLAAARPALGDGFQVIAPSRFGYLCTPLHLTPRPPVRPMPTPASSTT